MSYFDLLPSDLFFDLFLFSFNKSSIRISGGYLPNLIALCIILDEITPGNRYSSMLTVNFKNRYLLACNNLTIMDLDNFLNEKINQIMEFYIKRNFPYFADDEKELHDSEIKNGKDKIEGLKNIKTSLYNFFLNPNKSFDEISINLLSETIKCLTKIHGVKKDEQIRSTVFDHVLNDLLLDRIFQNKICFKKSHFVKQILFFYAAKIFDISGYEMFHIQTSSISNIFSRYPEIKERIKNMNENREIISFILE